MRTDIDNWESITITEINKLFSIIPIKWGIAGGWALDLHLGKQSRAHDDIDVIILRDEQLTAIIICQVIGCYTKQRMGNLFLGKKASF